MRKIVLTIWILTWTLGLLSPAIAQDEPLVQEIFAQLTLEVQASYFDLFGMKAGQTIYLYAESDDFDTQIILCDINCEEQLAENDDISSNNTNSALEYTFLEDGDYSILVWDCCVEDAEGTFRLLIGFNSPETLTGQAKSTGAEIASPYEDTYISGQSLFPHATATDIVPNNNSLERAILLHNQALTETANGSYERALEILGEALTIVREIDETWGEGLILLRIGEAYGFMKETDTAIDYFKEALEINIQVENIDAIKETLDYLIVTTESLGYSEDAINYHTQRLEIAEREGDLSTQFNTLVDLGNLRSDLHQYSQAILDLQQALELSTVTAGLQEKGHVLNSLGLAYRRLGQYQTALAYYEQALQIAEQINYLDGEGSTLNNMANILANQGQSALALEYFFTALEIARQRADLSSQSDILNNIAVLYEDQGRYSVALDYLEQALELAEQISDQEGIAITLNNLAGLYEKQQQYELAISHYERGLAIADQLGDKETRIAILLNLGYLYFSIQEYTQSVQSFETSLSLAQELDLLAEIAGNLNGIGITYGEMENYELAKESFEQALPIARQLNQLNLLQSILSNLSLASIYLEDLDASIEYAVEAIDVKESILNNAKLDTSIISLANQEHELNPYTILPQVFIARQLPEQALFYMERGRGILSRDELRHTPISFRQSVDASLIEDEVNLRLDILDAQNLINSLSKDLGASQQEVQNAQHALIEAQSTYDRHLEQMQIQGGFLERELALDVVPLNRIQELLSPNTMFLLFGTSPVGCYVVLITENTLKGFNLEVTTDEIETILSSYSADRRANSSALSELYTLIFAPIADQITTENLIISPDGILNYIPFAALQAPDGSYLIDYYNISYTPSGTVLVLLNDRGDTAQPTTNGLVLAQRDAASLPRLQNANSEAESIAADLGISAITNATEADLREGSTGAEVIHISAHAELNRFAPLYSVIHLGADAEYDGRLEVREIYELDLSQGTELVILSGCDTASGGTGEDFGLLTRAFFGAGADQVVASLWSVDDAATAELLTTFMEARETSASEAEALRLAMLATRENYPDPYYWASFVLVGQP